MPSLEQQWQSAADETLLHAAGELETYSAEAQTLILAEVERRGLQLQVPRAAGSAAGRAAQEQPSRLSRSRRELIAISIVVILLLLYVLAFIRDLKEYNHELRAEMGCIFLPISVLHGLSALLALVGALLLCGHLVKKYKN